MRGAYGLNKNMTTTIQKEKLFTGYQVFMIAMLAILQFTVILDFMVLSPLGVILLKELNMKTSQFGLVVSGYAISAGIAGIMAAGFADKYDRKNAHVFMSALFWGLFLCFGHGLSFTAYCSYRHRFIWRCVIVYRLCDYYRLV